MYLHVTWKGPTVRWSKCSHLGSGESRISLGYGCHLMRWAWKTIIWSILCWKLHENNKKIGPRRGHIPGGPLNLPMLDLEVGGSFHNFLNSNKHIEIWNYVSKYGKKIENDKKVTVFLFDVSLTAIVQLVFSQLPQFLDCPVSLTIKRNSWLQPNSI